jgi:hypothetical protein
VRAVDDAPGDAWSMLLEALAHLEESEESALDSLGADVLENLLRSHGDLIVDRLEEEAKQNHRLRLALRGVWLFDSPLRPRLDAGGVTPTCQSAATVAISTRHCSTTVRRSEQRSGKDVEATRYPANRARPRLAHNVRPAQGPSPSS